MIVSLLLALHRLKAYSLSLSFTLSSPSLGFPRHTRSQPLLKDADIEERQQVERSERIQEFRLQRDMVLERRKQEIIMRHELKRRQIELYDGIQVRNAQIHAL